MKKNKAFYSSQPEERKEFLKQKLWTSFLFKGGKSVVKLLECGNGLWVLNGVTTFYQNVANFKNDEVKFDNVTDGNVYKKVQKTYDMLIAA